MKRKQILIVLLSAVMLFSTINGTIINAQTADNEPEATEPVIEWYLPQTLKIGDWIQDVNTNPDEEDWIYTIGQLTGASKGSVVCREIYCNLFMPPHDAGAGPSEIVNGTADIYHLIDRSYAPGKDTLQVMFSTDNKNWEPLGEPYEIIIEEPIIETNAPQSIQVGESLDLITKLTNTSLTDEEVAPYLNPDNYDYYDETLLGGWNYGRYRKGTSQGGRPEYWPDHQIAYLPKVEIIEGQELVKQSNQNYTHILNSKETLYFTGTGTVKLKITYQQIMTCKLMGEWEYDEFGNPIGLIEDYRYNPTTTVTINVTDTSVDPKPSVSIIDEETGIQLDAQGGIVPSDTTIQIEKVTGNQYTMVSNSLKDNSTKFKAFDIFLLSNEKKVQPNGKVKITMPVPSDFDTEWVAVYYITDKGTLTQLPFTLSSDKKSLSFETDHFSIYTVAELKHQSIPDGSESTEGEQGTNSNENNSDNQGTSTDKEQGTANNENSSTNQGGTDSPSTGDTTSAFSTFILLIMSIMSMCIIVVLRKHKTN